MAEKYQNDKKFLVIKLPWTQFVALTDSWGMCYCCGKYDFNEDYYYVAMVNDFYCKNCFDAWYRYPEKHNDKDYMIERENYQRIEKKLKAMGVWNG